MLFRSVVMYDENILIFPNPAENKFIIQNIDADFKTIFLTDAVGNKIFSGMIEKSDFELNVETLRSGIYFVYLTGSERKSTVKKILIQK